MPELFGLLNINKPAGFTSRDEVNQIQRLVRPCKVGHAGTLDPLATGVLVMCLGRATRLIEYVQRLPKRYIATFELGKTSETEDIEGEVHDVPDAPQPTLAKLEGVLPDFTGTIDQLPPKYSALKLGGKRAYDLARAGKPVDLKPRPISIHKLSVVEYAYPHLVLDISCGSGTYVRSLGRDIAATLGTATVMTALLRSEIGGFRVADAVASKSLDRASLEEQILAPDEKLLSLPRIDLTAEELEEVSHGRLVQDRWSLDVPEIAAFGPSHNLAAIMRPHDTTQLRTLRNFVAPG